MMALPKMKADEVWTEVEHHAGGDTHVMEVVGGWVYRIREWSTGDDVSVSTVWVPDSRRGGKWNLEFMGRP